mgnify:CR=1 FL=1
MKKLPFHDAELLAVEHIKPTETLLLTFEFSGNEIERVTLGRVLSFRMTDFIGQNVVSRVLDSKVDRCQTAPSLQDCAGYINCQMERCEWMTTP